MKLRFEAIDGKGRVVRGVLRADDESEARDLLMAEEIYAKRFSPCPDEEPPTWAPKVRRQRDISQMDEGERRPVRHPFPTTLDGQSGQLGITESGQAIVFLPSEGEPRRITIDEIEIATLHGLLARQLTVTMNNGRALVFDAGSIFTSSPASAVARHIQSRKKSKES